MSFQLKLDPNVLTKLSSRGDNFTEWRSAWTHAFKYAGLWPHICGKIPATTTADVLEAQESKAMVMLLM